MTQSPAQSVLEMKFISYATPLELARQWGRTGSSPDPEQALELLQGLFQRYPHSIEIGQELALAYIESDDESSALRVLDALQLLCRNPNEEVLARCGRVFRDKGDRHLKYPPFVGPPEVRIGGESENLDDALRYYRLALEQYVRAYRIRKGHYPGVNVATLHLLIAALSAEEERTTQHEKCREVSRSLLDGRHEWPHEQDDDQVWHAASSGELHLLLREWDKAADCYRTALEHEKSRDFHRGAMLKQVIRIMYAHRKVDKLDMGPFEDLSGVFPPIGSKADDAG